jgi:hypothetical protein
MIMKLFLEQRVNSHFFEHLPKKIATNIKNTDVIFVFSQNVKVQNTKTSDVKQSDQISSSTPFLQKYLG